VLPPVARGPARVALHHGVPGRGVGLGLVEPPPAELGVRAAVDVQQHRVRALPLRQVHPPVHRVAVRRGRGELHLGRRARAGPQRGGEVGQPRERAVDDDAHLARRRRVGVADDDGAARLGGARHHALALQERPRGGVRRDHERHAGAAYGSDREDAARAERHRDGLTVVVGVQVGEQARLGAGADGRGVEGEDAGVAGHEVRALLAEVGALEEQHGAVAGEGGVAVGEPAVGGAGHELGLPAVHRHAVHHRAEVRVGALVERGGEQHPVPVRGEARVGRVPIGRGEPPRLGQAPGAAQP